MRVCTATFAAVLTAKPGKDRALGVVLVRGGIAKVRKYAVAQVLDDRAAEGLDLVGTAGVKCRNDLALLFWIEPRGQRTRPDHVAEHDRQLPTLGCGCCDGSRTRNPLWLLGLLREARPAFRAKFRACWVDTTAARAAVGQWSAALLAKLGRIGRYSPAVRALHTCPQNNNQGNLPRSCWPKNLDKTEGCILRE